MDVRAENRGRPQQKVRTSCGPGDGEKLFDPWASGRKGQECPREIRTKKLMFMLCFSSLNNFNFWGYFLLPSVCKRRFPNGGSSLLRRANSRTPFLTLFTSVLPKLYLNLTFLTSLNPLLTRQSQTTVWKPRFTDPLFWLQLRYFTYGSSFCLRWGKRK